MMRMTPGARADSPPPGVGLLLAILRARSSAQVARRLKCDPSAVRRWARGERRPGPQARVALCALYGLPLAAWEPCPAPPRSAGVKLLRELLLTRSSTDIARVLSCEPSAVRRWTRGERTPSRSLREMLEELFEIRVGAWGSSRRPVVTAEADEDDGSVIRETSAPR